MSELPQRPSGDPGDKPVGAEDKQKEQKGDTAEKEDDKGGENKGSGDKKGDKKGNDLGVKRDLTECGWVCACTLALGMFLACFFFNLYLVVRCFMLPNGMGMEGLVVMLTVSILVSLAGGCLVCAAIWYRVRRELDWCLVCVAAAGAMGCIMGFFGICIFCVYPMSPENARSRVSTAIRSDFDNYDLDVKKMNDLENQFDKIQRAWQCCGVVGPGDWSYYKKIEPPISCCKEQPCSRQNESMFNKGCQFAMQEVVFVGKLIAGFLGLLCLGMVILWIFITIKLIDHKHILTKEIDEKLDEDSEDDEQEIDVEHLKMD